jgi:hypothetical protein
VSFEARQKFAFDERDDETAGNTFTLSGPGESNHRVREIGRDEL